VRLRKSFIAAALIGSIVIAACGDNASDSSGTTGTTAPASTTPDTTPDTTVASTDTGATTTTAYVPPARGDADLVIWADDTRAPVLEPLATAFGEAEGLKVVVQQVPFDKIRDNLITSGPAGEGPDIIIGAHDWLGELVKNGVVEPVDLGTAAADYADVAVKAFTYDGKVYGLPYAIENIALIRNTDLVPEAPATWEDLEKVALQLKADGKVDVPLAIQQGPADPYHNFPLFSLTGANVFAQNADGTFDSTQLGLDTPEGLASADNFKKWSDEGLISKDITYDIMIESFGNGKAPFAITGPWAVSEADRGFKAKGVNYVVEPIPPLAGGDPAKVFVGVQGFMISSFSKNIDLAKTFLLDYVNKEDVQLSLFEAGGRPPAMTSAFDKVKTDPDVAGFGLAGQAGEPQPAIPAMSAVWDTWKDAYNLIFTGSDPQQAFKDAATTIRGKIG
jgi:maltose-binding protein MalE